MRHYNLSTSVQQQLEHVRERIQRACQRCGRSPASVTLVAVTKGVPPERINEAVVLGVTDVGENRIQEARSKRQTVDAWLGARGSGLGAFAQSPEPTTQSAVRIRWHMVGHLQRNKARQAVELFDVIHSADSLPLIDELERCAAQASRGKGPGTGGRGNEKLLQVFIQVNISGEQTKFGCKLEEALQLAEHVTQQSHLRLTGLMTIAPFVGNPENVRSIFTQLRLLRDQLQQAMRPTPHAPCPTPLLLSMGMSHDFEIAIEEGAGVVRIGTAIFGARGQGQGAGESK